MDIVKNMVEEIPDVLRDQRFVRNLFRQDKNVLKEFQEFLTKNRMSSHCWIWAEK